MWKYRILRHTTFKQLSNNVRAVRAVSDHERIRVSIRRGLDNGNTYINYRMFTEPLIEERVLLAAATSYQHRWRNERSSAKYNYADGYVSLITALPFVNGMYDRPCRVPQSDRVLGTPFKEDPVPDTYTLAQVERPRCVPYFQSNYEHPLCEIQHLRLRSALVPLGVYLARPQHGQCPFCVQTLTFIAEATLAVKRELSKHPRTPKFPVRLYGGS